MNKFKDKVAVITGGASGIGRTISEDLGSMGAIVVIADINEDGAAQAVKAIVSAGGNAQAVRVDVTEVNDIQSLIKQTVDEHGKIDYMFNNAGIAIHGEARDMNLDHWQHIIDINFSGILYGTITAYEQMVKQGFGHIVNTSSILGLVTMGTNVLYATTKHAVVGLSLSLRKEAKGLGVKVSCLCPGFIDTNLYDAATVVNADPKKFYGQIPFKRVDVKTASKKILKAVARNKSLVVFPMHARMMWWSTRMSPDALDRGGDIGMKQFRKIRGKS